MRQYPKYSLDGTQLQFVWIDLRLMTFMISRHPVQKKGKKYIVTGNKNHTNINGMDKVEFQ